VKNFHKKLWSIAQKEFRKIFVKNMELQSSASLASLSWSCLLDCTAKNCLASTKIVALFLWENPTGFSI
jgi:hypothetical protein